MLKPLNKAIENIIVKVAASRGFMPHDKYVENDEFGNEIFSLHFYELRGVQFVRTEVMGQVVHVERFENNLPEATRCFNQEKQQRQGR